MSAITDDTDSNDDCRSEEDDYTQNDDHERCTSRVVVWEIVRGERRFGVVIMGRA